MQKGVYDKLSSKPKTTKRIIKQYAEFCLRDDMAQKYWYANFECDVSGDIQKPFMCVIHNQNGTIIEGFRGENYSK